jgi:DMSO/TMAO reductase YedYZ heme-binding membrane subunit
MATQLTPSGFERAASTMSRTLSVSAAFLLPLGAGFAFAWAFASSIHNKNFPWITGRALGIAGYLALFALVALGVWMRHPWRFRVGIVHPEARLRAHATLGIATVALIAGHLVFLASDHYAGVGWVGALVPGLSRYRPVAVGLGVGAFELLLVIAATARFAGRRGTKHWLAIHRLASVTFALTWFHGVLAGTDTAALRLVYVATGVSVAFLVGTRAFFQHQSREGDGASHSTGPTRDTQDREVARALR